LAEALKEKYSGQVEDVKLVESSGGAFEVYLNEELLYSKLESRQFPTTEQVTTAINRV
jgi:selT/selW/selH-like putative selenoprotein